MIGTRFLAALLIVAPCTAHAEAIPIGLTAFSFLDTSGEVKDQTSAHNARLARFGDILKSELNSNNVFDTAAIHCGSASCPADELLAKAKAEGKRYVVLGAVQKNSTLVLWAQVDVVDVATGRPVLHRWITFRGDTDEAWDRTARFIAKAINKGFSG